LGIGNRRQRHDAPGSSWLRILVSFAALLALAACGASSAARRSMSVSTAGVPTSSSAPGSAGTVTAARPSTASELTSPTVSMRAVVAACRTSHLSLSLARATAAAGTAYRWYDLRNLGPTTCSMIGYPGVAVLNAHGTIVQHPAVRRAILPAPVRLVTLKPGRRAQFLLNSTDAVPSPGCPRAYRGVKLQVYPPNQITPLLRPFKGPFCNLRVGPVEPTG
jgi:hypothetical protein